MKIESKCLVQSCHCLLNSWTGQWKTIEFSQVREVCTVKIAREHPSDQLHVVGVSHDDPLQHPNV